MRAMRSGSAASTASSAAGDAAASGLSADALEFMHAVESGDLAGVQKKWSASQGAFDIDCTDEVKLSALVFVLSLCLYSLCLCC